VANEFVCARLAATIGLPVPPGELGRDYTEQVQWVTAVVGIDNETPAPEDPAVLAVREPDLAAGVLVFDVWILNVDRHEHNVISHRKLGLWVIDHDQALGLRRTGIPGALDQCKDAPVDRHIFRNCPLDAERLHAWGQRVRNVPRSALRRITVEGARRGLYSSALATELLDFIVHRQSAIHKLTALSLPPDKAQAEGGLSNEEGEDE
jgi:hypothetical protein